MSIDDANRLGRAFVRRGFTAVKLTGGDPALHPDLEGMVETLRKDAGFGEVEVISRHPAIGRRASELAAAGVTTFNLSLETLDATRHAMICGIDDHPQVLVALDQCVATGVPTKVNTVVMKGVNDHEIGDLIAHCDRAGVSTIKLLDVIQDLDHGMESFARRLKRLCNTRLRDLYIPVSQFVPSGAHKGIDTSTNGDLGHPLLRNTLPSGLTVLAKDSRIGAWYGSSCSTCVHFPCHDALMALRVTPDGRLQTCLLDPDCKEASLFVEPADAFEARIDAALDIFDRARFVTPGASIAAE